jgi:CheY-like chemotaxis protein
VAIEVIDGGVGMDAETLAKVFDPFFTTKDVDKGTGLSMVYGFARQSGGSVAIRSAPGKGTTVTLYLPRSMDHVSESLDSSPPVIRFGSVSETILVVEDDDDVRAHTVGTLRELGYRVIEAHDGPTALLLLEKQDMPVALLVTDVVMPRMSGTELATIARERRPGLKVLYTSGYTRDAITAGGHSPTGIDLLAKPFTLQTIAERVRDVLDR